MLYVTVESNNVYFEHGLKSLLSELFDNKRNNGLFPSLSLVQNGKSPANVIFRDFMVTINIKNNASSTSANKINQSENEDITIHVPFICKDSNFAEISNKVIKIILIANMEYSALIKDDVYKQLGVNRYLQLSVAENNIMLLMGEGNDTSDISKILKRSERTIGTHCRNAIKKMGMENRLEFYKYASFIARYGHKGEFTLCL